MMISITPYLQTAQMLYALNAPMDSESSLAAFPIDAVSVSTAEVLTYVTGGKLKTLAVMADKRIKGFESVPTLKERNIDLTVGSWAGLGVPKNTPPKVVEYLKTVSAKAMQEPTLLEVMDKQNLNAAYADDMAFKNQMARDNTYFKELVEKLKLRN